MTRRSVLEHVKAVRPRYLKALKEAKTKILDEFIATTGMHRKAAIRLLNRRDNLEKRKNSGRPRQYDIAVEAAIIKAWEATDRLCSKRLQPFLPELVKVLMRAGEIKISAEIKSQLVQMSASTIDRMLRRHPYGTSRHKFSTTRPGIQGLC